VFEQVTTLLSFVYAIALTHLLSSVSEMMSAFIGVYVVSVAINDIDRDIFFGRQPTDWIMPNVVLLASLLPVVVAGWGPRWTQWLGGLAILATGIQFLVASTITN